jgi:hypothetical protein
MVIGQRQIGLAGLSESARPLEKIGIEPKVSGKRHSQQTSVMGFTKWPLHGLASGSADGSV